MSIYTGCRKVKISKGIKILITGMSKAKCKINPKKITLLKEDTANNKFSNFKNRIKL